MEKPTKPDLDPEEEKDAQKPPLIHLKVPRVSEPPQRDLGSITDALYSPDATSGVSLTIAAFGVVTQHIGVAATRIVDTSNAEALREWWHNLLRAHGKYACYGIFLVLEADREAIKYLTAYANELHQASGEDTAILGLRSEIDALLGLNSELQSMVAGFNKPEWLQAVLEQVQSGNSLQIAERFGIPLTYFPAVILFRDIRSSEYILVRLKGLTAEQIAEKMRGVYQAIHQAVEAKTNPLEAVRKLRREETYRLKTRHIVSGIRRLANATLETVLEALFKAMIQ